MNSVSVAELKARLSEYLAMVQEGRTLTVTSHRRPVARLTPTESATELLPVQRPTHSMEVLAHVKGVTLSRGADGVAELISDRRRR